MQITSPLHLIYILSCLPTILSLPHRPRPPTSSRTSAIINPYTTGSKYTSISTLTITKTSYTNEATPVSILKSKRPSHGAIHGVVPRGVKEARPKAREATESKGSTETIAIGKQDQAEIEARRTKDRDGGRKHRRDLTGRKDIEAISAKAKDRLINGLEGLA